MLWGGQKQKSYNKEVKGLDGLMYGSLTYDDFKVLYCLTIVIDFVHISVQVKLQTPKNIHILYTT